MLRGLDPDALLPPVELVEGAQEVLAATAVY